MEPSAIITGDIHLREDRPICRTDDYFAALSKKIKWLRDIQIKYGCPIFDAGDLFAKSKPSYFLVQWAIKYLPRRFHSVPGNHDLPSHNLSLLEKSALGLLSAAEIVRVLTKHPISIPSIKTVIHPYPWGVDIGPLKQSKGNSSHIALCHVMTFTGEAPWPGCVDLSARELLRKMKGYDLVITGHNHKPFVIESRGRLLVNPGSLMRSSASQINYKPRIYLWYQEDNHVEPIYVPIEANVITTEHLDKTKEKDIRINAFVEQLSKEMNISSSFERNMEEYFKTHETTDNIKHIVWSALGEE